EIERERLLHGEPVADAMARWRDFLRPDDVLAVWGRHTLDLLRAEAVPPAASFDLRAASIAHLGLRPGGVEQAAAHLGRVPVAWTAGRAGRRIAALAEIAHGLSA